LKTAPHRLLRLGDETEQKIYKDSIVRFNALYPGVKVDFQPIPTDFQRSSRPPWPAARVLTSFYVDSS
jgi:hypothetical protein